MAIFDPILNALGWLLSIFYSLPPHNLGVAIILLTFTIMGALYPLTAKQARSMIAMQMVQPEIKRIQAKYKNDRAKLNEEMMKFYQENKINPLAGCLPLLIQMPIFFALFRVLRNPYEYVPTSSKLYSFLCTPTGASAPVGVNQCGKVEGLPRPTYFLGMNLSLSAPDQKTLWASILAFALVILVMFTGYMQSRQAQKRTPAINKQMAMITKALPVFFGFISLNFPSGLVLYFFVSNLWRLGQQEVIFRRFGTAADPKHKSLMNPPKANIVDAESRERDTAVAVEDEPDTSRRSEEKRGTTRAGGNGTSTTPARTEKPPKGGPTAGAGKPVIAPTTRGGGGLRGLFKPPPPPTGKPTAPQPAKPAAKPAPAKKSSSGGTTSRPGQAGRRTSKKKKKR
jgi:YidC/Oxa1 family membrane protein insertase